MLERRTLFLRHYGGPALFGWVCYSITSRVPICSCVRTADASCLRSAAFTVRQSTLVLTGGRDSAALSPAGCGAGIPRMRRAHGHGSASRGLLLFGWSASLIGDPGSRVFVVCVGNFFMAFTSGTRSRRSARSRPASCCAVASPRSTTRRRRWSDGRRVRLSALCTDYLFRDPARVGDSIALVCAVVGPVLGLITWRALPSSAGWRCRPALDRGFCRRRIL